MAVDPQNNFTSKPKPCRPHSGLWDAKIIRAGTGYYYNDPTPGVNLIVLGIFYNYKCDVVVTVKGRRLIRPTNFPSLGEKINEERERGGTLERVSCGRRVHEFLELGKTLHRVFENITVRIGLFGFYLIYPFHRNREVLTKLNPSFCA